MSAARTGRRCTGDRQWAALAHCLGVPLAGAATIRMTVGRRDAFVGHHAAEALNFQVLFWGLLALTLVLPGWDLWLRWASAFTVFFVIVIWSCYAARQACAGRWWRYPVSAMVFSGPNRNLTSETRSEDN